MLSKYIPVTSPQEKAMPFYLTSVGNPKYQPPVFRPNGIDAYMLLYFVSGEAECWMDGQKYEIKKGMMLLTPPGVEHNYHMKHNFGETWYITFNGNGLGAFLGSRGIIFKIDDEYDVIGKYQKLAKLRSSPGQHRSISKVLYSFLVDMDMFIQASARYSTEKKNVILEAIDVIRENDCITLSEISERFGISREYFCRLFRNYTGYTLVEYINILKIQKAKKLLRETEKSVSEIAAETGFQSHSYFTLKFRKLTGISPSEFRKNTSGLQL